MSVQITEAFVRQFSDNVYTLSQQKGSKLRPHVRQETIKGKAKAFDRIGSVDVVQKTSRHGNTPQLDTPHSRRWCFLVDYEWADLIDDLDKVRILNDPTSEYVMAAMWANGRRMDKTILNAAEAAVTTGEEGDGSTTVAHPNSQKYAANDGTNFTNLNLKTLIAIKEKFGLNDVDESIPLHIACTQRQISSLLGEEKVTSSDYAQIKALVRGEVDTFLGFTFHRTNLVNTEATTLAGTASTGAVGSGASMQGFRKVVAWAKDGIILGVGADIKARVSERSDKSYATQAYTSMAIGGTRMEEEKVVIAFCKES